MLNLKKKVLMSFATLSLATALVGGATFALFTDETVNANNTFAAGTVDIVLNDQVSDETTGLFNIPDIAPGDSGSIPLKVHNSGSLDFRYDVEVVRSGALFEGDTPIVLTLKSDSGETWVWDKNSEDFRDLNRELKEGKTDNLTMEWYFPLEANNDYQEATGSFSVNFTAEQTRNNPIE